MLAIRMQRTGRTGHAQFRLIVQDSRFSPKSGRVVAYIGSYNPHSKAVTLDKEMAEQYLSKGAQPSPRLVKILKNEGVKLPNWVREPAPKKRATRNPEKLRRNRPAGAPKSEPTTEAGEKTAETEPAELEIASETEIPEAPEPQAGEAEKAVEEKPTKETPAKETGPEEPTPTPKGSGPQTPQDANVGADEPASEEKPVEDQAS